MTGAISFSSYSAVTGTWYWTSATLGGTTETSGKCLMEHSFGLYYYAGPNFSVKCISSGENEDKYEIKAEYYVCTACGPPASFVGANTTTLYRYLDLDGSDHFDDGPFTMELTHPTDPCEITFSFT